jgi:ABC-type nitrate/sulfonate/bicarbonate transport system permease component
LSVALARCGVGALPFVVVGAPREIIAGSGFSFSPVSTLETIASAFIRRTACGVLSHHVADTVLGPVTGFVLAAIVGIAIGNAVGRSRLNHVSWGV